MKAHRVIPDAELVKLFRTLDTYATAGTFEALRDRAMYRLCLGSGLRLSECLSVDVEDLVHGSRLHIASRFLLPASKAKGGAHGEGYIMVGKRARAALRAYLSDATARGWVDKWSGPLWVTARARGGEHGQLTKRAVQASWSKWQARAALRTSWRWHDMRHTAITKFSSSCGGNAFRVAAFARHADMRNTLNYVHSNPDDLQALAEDL